MAEVPFEIGGQRWRVFSSKNLAPSLTGEWKVSVLDASGSALSSNTFAYSQAPEPSATSDTMPKEMSASPTEAQQAPAPKTE
jgi:hypothetical protein